MSIKNILIPCLTFGAGVLVTKLLEDDRHKKTGAGTSAATLLPAPSTRPSVLTENGKPVTQYVTIEKEDRQKKIVIPYLGNDYYIKELIVDLFDGSVAFYTNDGKKAFNGVMEKI